MFKRDRAKVYLSMLKFGVAMNFHELPAYTIHLKAC
jgi:hypothetical protein